MDALLKEREAFKKRAMAMPVVEKKIKAEPPAATTSKDVKKMPRPPSAPKLDATSYKTMTMSSQYRFGVLAKIVRHMRIRHLDGDDHPLTLDEILDETNQLDIGSSTKTWLATEALLNNPKIDVTADQQRFLFKPVYNLRDGKSLVRLLRQYHTKGLGGIMLDDVQESLPHWEKVLKMRATEILIITRPVDKKKVLFYNDPTFKIEMDEEFKKLWRSIAVDALDDEKIEEYLKKQGISSMSENGGKKVMTKRKKVPVKKLRQFKKPRDNEHLADVLETYGDNTLTQKGEAPSTANTQT